MVAPVLAILRLVAEAEQPMGVNAIARELAIAPSSCFKILKQLQTENFVEFNERTKAYSIGYGAIQLARRALDPLHAFPTLRPRLVEIGERFSVAIGFWRRTSRSRIVLAGYIEGSSPLRIHMSVGQRVPLLVGGVGRAFAARLGLSEAELRQEFALLRWQSPISFEEYLAQVEEARRRGYAIDRNNFASGVTVVASALCDARSSIGYGVSAIMFSGQHDADAERAIGEMLTSATDWAAPLLVTSPS